MVVADCETRSVTICREANENGRATVLRGRSQAMGCSGGVSSGECLPRPGG
jgi:hypothetical protein